jgi:hypothetical protein
MSERGTKPGATSLLRISLREREVDTEERDERRP